MNSRRRGTPSSTDTQESASPFRSPSPSCMPNPSFNGKGYETGKASTVDTACEQGVSIPSSGSLGDGLLRSASGVCTSNKARSKESQTIPIPKPKWKEANKTTSMCSGDSQFLKPDNMKYSPKVKTDIPHLSRSTQDCSCAEDGLLGTSSSLEEASTSSLYSDCRPFGDDCGSGNLWQESKVYGSLMSQFCSPKNRYIQRPKNDKVPAQRSYFQPHWSSAKVEKALEEGEAFRCKIRMNVHSRMEAYVSIDGVAIDVLIDGTRAQNRAIDGDVVAIVINPVSAWTKLRGSVAKQNSSDLSSGLTEILACNNESLNTEVSEFSSDEGQYDSLEQMEEVTSGGFSSKSSVEADANVFSDVQLMTIGKMMDDRANCQLLGDSSMQNDSSKNQRNEQKQHGLQSESTDVSLLSNGSKALQDFMALVASYPDKRPTGEVVAILEKSDRREAVVGFLEIHQKAGNKCREDPLRKLPHNNASTLMLVPSDSRFPKMAISVNALPTDLKKKYHAGDTKLESELVAALVIDWRPDSFTPYAVISHSLGQGGEIEAQLDAILFEHAVHSAEFPSAVLKCLPEVPWNIPIWELERRRDLTRCRIFTIDPPTARDLDDALSIDRLDNGFIRIGVHIADVSYFVRPDTALDKEAQNRSTSVYLIQRVLPMLPRLLCEELCSLNPSVDRLAFSIIWDVDNSGQIVDHWIGRTIIKSCCKLSYAHAQDIIDGNIIVNSNGDIENCTEDFGLPELHGNFKWGEIFDDVKALHDIAKHRRDARFEAGALRLQNSRLVFALDEDGIPNNSSFYQHQDSNFLVEEFMLLANMTAAKVIAGAFPDCALLRRHPEPNPRKMKELEEFCNKNGLELDASSSGALHESLRKLCESHKGDSAFCSILMLYATKPMQLAKYFSTGELKNEEEWAHYALATPFYTHFTSPIRRYADIVVHRTLAAALEAEDLLLGSLGCITKGRKTESVGPPIINRYFTGPCLDKHKVESPEGQQALFTAASKHKVPGNQELAMLAEHCNRRKLASRNVRDASDKLYLWAMLKKEGILSEARVLAVGPKFVSLYVYGIAMERRVYYEDTEGLTVEWFNMTGTVILDLMPQRSFKKEKQGRGRAFTDVAYLVNPAYSCDDTEVLKDVVSSMQEGQQVNANLGDESVLEFKEGTDADKKPEAAVLPLTLRLLAPVPVQVFAIGGDSRPLDIAVRLYLSSYLQ